MLEKMKDFFDNRAENYEEHQLNNIDCAKEFYPFTAKCLPTLKNVNILDLGCGTGLELEEYFKLNPSANITGIDLAPKMLSALKKKFPDKNLNLINASYFDVPFGENKFDAAVSAESIHHFSKSDKISLYTKLHKALKDNGFFILTDYFALSDEEEQKYMNEFSKLKSEHKAENNEIYHYDTPLTVPHEIDVLKFSGFSNVKVLKTWGATATLKAVK